MRIVIETIEHKDQRYDTVGDWQFIGDELVIKVSKLGDEAYEFLVGIHEAIEAFLCKAYGITTEEVDAFDMANKDSSDPGSIPTAPYYRQHLIATILEHVIADELEVDWDMYDSRIEQVDGTTLRLNELVDNA